MPYLLRYLQCCSSLFSSGIAGLRGAFSSFPMPCPLALRSRTVTATTAHCKLNTEVATAPRVPGTHLQH